MYATSEKWKEYIYINTQKILNIYIDNTLINSDYILSFKKGGNVFEEEFSLGGTPCQYIELRIYKNGITNPQIIKVEYGIKPEGEENYEIIPMGIYNVDDYTDNDDGTVTIKALDNMIKFEANYDGSELISKGEATLLEVAKDICNKVGVELKSTSFLNSNKKISVYDSTVAAREYIGYIAENAGCFACIDREGNLHFKDFYQNEIELDIDLFGSFKWGEEFKISKVSYEDGIRSFKFGDDTRNNLWINQENMYIVDEEQIQNIYNKINGLVINSFEGKTVIDPAIDIGDKVIIDGKPVIYQGDMTLSGKFIAEISSKIQIKAKEETTTRTVSDKTAIRRVQSRIDQAEGTITQLVKETTTLEKNTIKTVQVQYALSDSTTTAPTSGWSTTAPTWESGKYMWQRTVTTYSDNTTKTSTPTCIQGAKGENGADGKDGANGKDGTNGKDGAKGDTGIGVSLLETEYYLSTSNTEQVGGEWLKTEPEYEADKYYWTRSKITWTDNSVTYTDPILAEGINNANQSVDNITNTEGTATGKNIHIEDSSEEPLVDIVVKGETKQATRSGKNFFDNTATPVIQTNSTRKALDTGIRIISNTKNTNSYDCNLFVLKKLTDYVGKTVRMKVNLKASAENKPLYSIGISTVDGTSRTKKTQDGSSGKEISFVVPELTDGKEYLMVWLYFNAGGTIEIGDYVDYTDLIVTIDNEDMTYEPYGASPSPDYPSEIENVEGKNLFNKNTMATIYARYISTTNEWKASYDSASVLFPCKPNKTYTISHSCKNLTVFKCAYIKENKENITPDAAISVYNAFLGTTQLSHTIGTGEGATYIIIQASLSYIDEVIETLQLEEGTVATEYVPYNSLEFEVMRKNLFDKNNLNIITNGYLNNTGLLSGNTKWGTTDYINVKANTNYISHGLSSTGTNPAVVFYDNDKNYIGGLKHDGVNPVVYTTPKNCKYIRDSFYLTDINTFMIEEGSVATDYEPYKSQTATFPLAEGQKLYEGSYLADDGIHHTRGQIVLDGTEGLKYLDQNEAGLYRYVIQKLEMKNNYATKSLISSHFETANTYTELNKTTMPLLGIFSTSRLVFCTKFITLQEFKDWLAEQYSNGTPVIVEYELAEEEIIPYTEEQQEAWNKIKELYTYKNITNITSTADLDIVYVRDNGLSDMYETKQNANKRYEETIEKFAETKITTDGIQDTVSKTETIVANNYKELKTKFNDYAPKSDIVTLQNSVEKIQTDTYTKTEINTKLTDGSVTKVQTTAGTFDEDGLTIEKTNAKTKGKFNEKGMQVVDATGSAEEILLFAGYDETTDETIVKSKNMTVEKYLVVGANCRFEDYENPTLGGKGTGVFSL